MWTGAIIDSPIRLVDVEAGRGNHRQFSCPTCSAPARLLRASSETRALHCARCRPHRTARQLERSTRWWRRLGGRELDELLRLAHRPGFAKLNRMEELVQLLLTADRRQAHELEQDVMAAQHITEKHG